ncbi:hypothetical protein Q1695_004209 [Nippostrongylus brasiliensis]|nr:hypothetical protein Q1695_004209 [Nippostrongylus brasiliensis]
MILPISTAILYNTECRSSVNASRQGINGSIKVNTMNDLVDRLKTNDSLPMTYIDYNSVLWKPNMPQGRFRCGQLCSIEFSDYSRYRNCLAQCNFSSFVGLNWILLISVIFGALLHSGL